MADKIIPDSPIHNFPASVPFPRSYWVVPGKLLAGCYPGSEDKDEAHQKLKGLLDHGIRHIINLMEPDEFNWDMKPFEPYEGEMKSIAASMGIEVTFKRVPIRNGWVSTRTDMSAILDSIDYHIEDRKVVYGH